MADEGPSASSSVLGFKSVEEFSQEGMKRIDEATKAFQALPPPGPLWDLQKSYPEFSRAMRNSRTRILPIMKALLKHSKISTHDFKGRDVEEKFDFIERANDDILERIATALDDASGLSAKPEIIVVGQKPPQAFKPRGTWAKRKPMDASEDSADSTIVAEKTKSFPVPSGRPIKKAVHRIRVTEKPQLKFKVPVDNSLAPFVPKLKDKPNSLKPLSILPEFNGKNEEYYGHPYQTELNRWEADSKQMDKVSHPSVPPDMSTHPWILVQTTKELEALVTELLKVDEIGVDVEHHSYRTFLGITCVIQLSTRTSDYIIDAIALREDLGCLNQVLTKPKIVKVFHGASSDIEWLQRDFGLYVVGMFDTYVASKQLGFEQLSLQFLLNKYCKVLVDKKYQLADWRIRPLPEDMLFYARQDTHYLLYLYDVLKNELISSGNQFKNLLSAVYDESNMICQKRYEKPTVNPQLALRKTRRALNNRQLYAFTEIYKWRDETAREKDESLGYVLPNHMLFMIAETLPKEMTGILACCDPVPALVHNNLGVLHRIVLKARDLPVHEEKVQGGTTEKRKKLKNWVVIMNSLHDIEGDDQEGGAQKPDMDLNTKTWPEPCKAPENMDGIQLRSQATLFIGRKTKTNITSRKPAPARTGATQYRPVRKTPGTSNAFERYELSCQILETLKDPKKKASLDMNDPTVKVVYETLYVDPAEEEAASLKKLSVVNQELINVMPKSDFVPFNPVAEFMKQQAEESRKNKKKKPTKNEVWIDDKPFVIPLAKDEDSIGKAMRTGGIGADLIDVSSDDEDEVKPLPTISLSKSEKKRDKKKNKGKLAQKLKFWKNKRKHEENEEEAEEGEIVCLDDEDEEEEPTPAPPKKFKDIQAERYPSTSTSDGNNSSNNDRRRRKDRNGGKGNHNHRGGKRSGGFFNSFRKQDGRSLTYK